jgi:hypothetical protein|nr:MAG TPA: hypothetical protein [Caudoviricetes sp.]
MGGAEEIKNKGRPGVTSTLSNLEINIDKSHINRIREGYISMMGAKDEQILELMRLVDKLTSK